MISRLLFGWVGGQLLTTTFVDNIWTIGESVCSISTPLTKSEKKKSDDTPKHGLQLCVNMAGVCSLQKRIPEETEAGVVTIHTSCSTVLDLITTLFPTSSLAHFLHY